MQKKVIWIRGCSYSAADSDCSAGSGSADSAGSGSADFGSADSDSGSCSDFPLCFSMPYSAEYFVRSNFYRIQSIPLSTQVYSAKHISAFYFRPDLRFRLQYDHEIYKAQQRTEYPQNVGKRAQ